MLGQPLDDMLLLLLLRRTVEEDGLRLEKCFTNDQLEAKRDWQSISKKKREKPRMMCERKTEPALLFMVVLIAQAYR
jgi:hypothetical protein